MKKFITAILSVMLILQSAMCVSAATTNVGGTEVTLTVQPQIDLLVKGGTATNWASSTTIYTSQNVELKATIDMTNVRTAFVSWYNAANDLRPGITGALHAKPIISNGFYVKLEYPQEVTLSNATMTKSDMSDFSADTNDIFEANGPREHTPTNLNGNQELKIPFKVKDNITVGYLKNYTSNGKLYFPDMEITATGVTALKDNAPHTVKGFLDGDILVNHDGNSFDISATIDFVSNNPEAIINVVDAPVSPGGGSLSYTLSFVSNGGTEFEPKSYRNGAVVNKDDLPVPERAGYEFTGWYTDEGLTEKFESVKMTKNATVYAGWRKKDLPGGPVPEMLNGDDHFAYVIGYPDGTVQPHGSITRAEVVTIFFRLLKDDVRDSNLTYENDYSDVAEGSWYNGAISTMTALGIVNGKSGDKFAPNDDITRGEFAAIVSRFADKAAEISHDFTDVDGHWAESDIYNAAAHGWIMGYEDESFRPDRDITRAEAMTLINRVCARVPETTADLLDDMAKWSDNMDTSVWYYIAVQEATNSHVYERKANEYEKWTEMRENRDWSTYEK